MSRQLSRWERIDAFVGWLSVAAELVKAAVSGPFRGRSGADTYRHHVIQAVVKKDQIYVEHCQKHGDQPHFVSTNLGVNGFWIGDPSAKYVVIQFHGGGFAMDATEPHLHFWRKIQSQLADAGITTTWFHSMYTLTPHEAYPSQIREAVETLRYIMEDIGRLPGEVLIAGDSAGGNLCLAILSHLKHRLEDIPELIVNEPLKGQFFYPLGHDWPTAMLNKDKDIDAQEVTSRWSQLYLNGRASNNFVEAVDASEEWWVDIQVEQTLVLAGADEVLLDPIKAWFSKFERKQDIAND
ncbi:alpha/beta hydrolase fold protein [Penicillium canescens]|nr:alpha/beta hydrolase fold protein [Penicillium canescens]